MSENEDTQIMCHCLNRTGWKHYGHVVTCQLLAFPLWARITPPKS